MLPGFRSCLINVWYIYKSFAIELHKHINGFFVPVNDDNKSVDVRTTQNTEQVLTY